MSKGATINEIATSCNGKLIGFENNQKIVHYFFDSRKVFSSPHALFVAIKSNQNDGHSYIAELIDKGIRCFLIQNEQALIEHPECCYIVVENTLVALQQMATWYRKQFTGNVMAITGSNGKTIVKEWLFEVLKKDLNISRSPRSFNSKLGVPISILSADIDSDLVLIEAGISKVNEMQFHQTVIAPNIGIFTTIGDAHSENFKSNKEKIVEKLILFKNAQYIIVSDNHQEIINEILEQGMGEKLFTWGFSETCAVKITEFQKLGKVTKVKCFTSNQIIELELPFTDDASIENAMHVFAAASLLKSNLTDVAQELKQLKALSMRLAQKKGINQCTLLDDSYSSDMQSLENALQALNQLPNQEKILILSDFVEIGKSGNEIIFQLQEMLTRFPIHRIYAVGEKLSLNQHLLPPQTYFYTSTEKFLNSVKQSEFNHQAILIKGARIFEFEKIADFLQEQSHESVLEIDLRRLSDNLNYYKNLLPEKVKIMAMVKALGYGSGGGELAQALQNSGVSYLAVAYADEGIALRQAGIRLPIMVMSPELASVESIIRYNLEPEIFSFRILNAFKDHIKSISTNEKLKLHIKFNTGMNRLGFEVQEVEKLVVMLQELHEEMEVVSVFSHLSAANDLSASAFTLQQIKTIGEIGYRFKSQFGNQVLIHSLNTSGIEHYPEGFFDMVRLGIGLYGVSNKSNQLKLISSLKSRISQLRWVKMGERVGYGLAHVMQKDTLIATVPLGYADGLSRNLNHSIYRPTIRQTEVNFAANICMDMCMLDVSVIENVAEGDEVNFFSEKEHVYAMAQALNTIPYEILTNISSRVKRIFVQ